MKELLKDIKKTIVFLGTMTQNGPSFFATGFLIQNEGFFYLVTAKHVIVKVVDGKLTNNLNDNNLYFFLNLKNGIGAYRKLSEIKSKSGIDWIFHKDSNVDLAIIPIGLDTLNDDVKVINEDNFLNFENLFETYETFFLSFQPGIDYKKVNPIIRSGTVSLINDDKTFYIDASAFPGNSGSPVFLKPSPIRFDSGGISIGGGDELGGKFAGVIGEYIPYTEVAISAQTGKPRIVFEENTGLSKVWSNQYIKDILSSDEAKKQVEHLKKLNEK